jgi:hypothetical protein
MLSLMCVQRGWNQLGGWWNTYLCSTRIFMYFLFLLQRNNLRNTLYILLFSSHLWEMQCRLFTGRMWAQRAHPLATQVVEIAVLWGRTVEKTVNMDAEASCTVKGRWQSLLDIRHARIKHLPKGGCLVLKLALELNNKWEEAKSVKQQFIWK